MVAIYYPTAIKGFAEMKLIDVIPKDADGWALRQAEPHMEKTVTETIMGYDCRFPFKHKNIHVWWILDDGTAVGWNESPTVGWGFPVKKIKQSN